MKAPRAGLRTLEVKPSVPVLRVEFRRDRGVLEGKKSAWMRIWRGREVGEVAKKRGDQITL